MVYNSTSNELVRSMDEERSVFCFFLSSVFLSMAFGYGRDIMLPVIQLCHFHHEVPTGALSDDQFLSSAKAAGDGCIWLALGMLALDSDMMGFSATSS